MFKIEFQYKCADGSWKKGKHRLYETEKAFAQYWKHHCKDYDTFHWNFGSRRLVGMKDGEVIKTHWR